ncbi:hypothetical protein LCGC14_1040380 [marine sediment metagenome]|uniref:Uncharacterized protein n=1 Tax=marine sediment metagenome TaxID=412755 RepID=A0A0F9MWG2_9ZZZZ
MIKTGRRGFIQVLFVSLSALLLPFAARPSIEKIDFSHVELLDLPDYEATYNAFTQRDIISIAFDCGAKTVRVTEQGMGRVLVEVDRNALQVFVKLEEIRPACATIEVKLNKT